MQPLHNPEAVNKVIDKLMADYQLDPLAPKQPAPDKAASAEAESIASAAINKTTAAKTTGKAKSADKKMNLASCSKKHKEK